MTPEQVQSLENGLYQLFWNDGGSSLASVGRNASGEVWYAPRNWLTVPGWDWGIIKNVVRVLEEPSQSRPICHCWTGHWSIGGGKSVPVCDYCQREMATWIGAAGHGPLVIGKHYEAECEAR
jgi:hypothetical protein